MGPDEGADAANELEIDEDLTLLQRMSYCTSSISVQRLVHVRELANCAEEVGAQEAVKHLLPLLKSVANDPELAIRQVRTARPARLAPRRSMRFSAH